MLHFLVHGRGDNVAVAVVEVQAGKSGQCLNMETDHRFEVQAEMDIPLGHKIALQDFGEGDTIVKYDHDIGRVVAPIKKGDHVHVHNVKTKRW
jgi:(2R)-sulfolactate sulfo-lyase subunit alpha